MTASVKSPKRKYFRDGLLVFAAFVIAIAMITVTPTGAIQQAFLRWKVFPSVKRVLVYEPGTGKFMGGGTGFVTDHASGFKVIVTNSHVCGMEAPFKNRLDDGTQLLQIRVDVISDLCVLVPLDGTDTEGPSLALANRAAKSGDKVFVAGHPRLQPLALSVGDAFVVSQDIIPVGNKERIEKRYGAGTCADLGDIGILMEMFTGASCAVNRSSLYVTTPIMPGNSGSPVLNQVGEVVGVVWGFTSQEGMGLVVPLENLRRILGFRL